MIQSQSERGYSSAGWSAFPAPPPTALTTMSTPAEAGHGRLDHPLAVRLAGRVGGDRQALRAGCPDALDRGLAALGGAAGDGHAGSGSGERLRERRSDGAAAAHDEGGPVLPGRRCRADPSSSSPGGRDAFVRRNVSTAARLRPPFDRLSRIRQRDARRQRGEAPGVNAARLPASTRRDAGSTLAVIHCGGGDRRPGLTAILRHLPTEVVVGASRDRNPARTGPRRAWARPVARRHRPDLRYDHGVGRRQRDGAAT